MNDSTPTDQVDAGKATMRGLIHTHGIAKATAMTADHFTEPFDTTERDTLAGMILAAYEAGQLDGAGKAWMNA